MPASAVGVTSNVRPQMPTHVRLATQEDAAAIAEVLLQSRQVFLPYAPLAHSPSQVRQWVADHLVPSGPVLVAVESGQVVGFLASSERDASSWIDQLYVRPGHESRGVGSQLLAVAHSGLRLPIRLFTFQANVRARCFYQRHGYQAVRFSDGAANEEHCPDVLYERSAPVAEA